MSRPGLATFTSFENQRSSPTPTLIKHNPLYDPNNNGINNSTNSTHTTHQPNNASFPSPTLTNPDMILPYESERECSTPSPPFQPLQLPSPDHPSYRRSSVQAQNGMHVSSAGIGVAVSLPATLATASGSSTAHHQPVKNPPPPRNNWVFEGHEIRPPLSDIGEEESPPRARWSGSEGGNVRDGEVERMVLDSSPVLKPQQWRDHRDLGYEGYGDHGHGDEDCDDDAASCSASSSTISAPTEILERWEEFAADRGEHAKESGSEDMAEREGGHCETDYGTQEQTTMDAEMERNNMAAIKEEDDETDDEISSAMLSKEAERILENAKKRLTHMEGNLNRARTSFRMTPSPSLLLSGTIALNARQSAGITGRSYSMIGERRAQTSLAGALMRQRVSQDLSANGTHSRGLSDASIQNNMGNNIRDGKPQFRSFSALGSTNASGYGANDASPKHDRFESRGAYQPSMSTFNYVPEDRAEPVINSHNSVSQPASPSSKTNSPRQNAYEQLSGSSSHARANHIPKISSVEEFNAVYPASAPSRSQSQLHVRGLQDQMQDLRSKISTLKVQAQEDNLRRRSLQSLRTPSPFTAAEQWYTSAHDRHDANGKVADGHWASQADEGNNDDEEEHHESPREQSPESVLDNVLAEDQLSIADSHYEDADEEFAYDDIDRVALAEILNEPLDSPISGDEDELFQDFPPMPPVPEGTRHEDREDAFDYEHFFLHSALGNYSRSKARPRRQSYDSTGSVETTRPASQGSVYTSPRGRAHVRNNSADSISTAATFATATEGMEEDEYSGDEIDNALYWNGNGSGGIYQYQNKSTHHSHGHSRRTTVLASPSSPTRATSPQSAASTPRAKQSRHSRHASSSSSATRTQSPSPLPAPTTIISSLIASAASQLTPPSAPPAPAEQDSSLLNADDMRLMEGLLQSLGTVALQLQFSTARGDKRASADERSSLLFRRRLDAARRVLEGELDA